MENIVLLYWIIFNVLYGGLEYIFYLQQKIGDYQIFPLGRKLILPLIKILIAAPIAYYYTTYDHTNEIFINILGIYFIGAIFHQGTFFQLRKLLLSEDELHFFSHSLNTLLSTRNVTILDMHAGGRTLLTLLGYFIIFGEHYSIM